MAATAEQEQTLVASDKQFTAPLTHILELSADLPVSAWAGWLAHSPIEGGRYIWLIRGVCVLVDEEAVHE